MLARLAQFRQVTCPDCKGEGYVAASASEWEPWFRAYTQAQTHHQDVLQAYLAGTATRAELDAAVGALTDVVSSPSADLAEGMATVVPLRAAWSGGACEGCGGYGVQPRQRRIIARPRRLVARPAA